MTRHWWLFWLAFFLGVAVLLLTIYGCSELTVGLKQAASGTPTTRPFVEITRGDTTGDPWIPYALLGGLIVVAMCSPPPCWLWRRWKRRK